MNVYRYSDGFGITGDEIELCVLGRVLEAVKLDPYWNDEGDQLLLDDDNHPQDKIASFLKAYFELRNLNYEITWDCDRNP
ncbi:hypothetical protein I8748_05495 [Nostoc sp. CENA67]|uniref:Uncharacterized protein n=1 Tax=Amazonocrinis nigriterrae CENA67 TaxID=2794033 RepID=A0A8J7HL46_9NOST|nr:hypothetical protein [Amazonocrinis nigriterrae]MBH8561637.1 hypothetical protein [Amazonocrinis nigriterrae CENA67]